LIGVTLPLLLPSPSLVGDYFDIEVMFELRRLLIATTGFTKFKSSFVSICYYSFLLGVRNVAEKGLEKVEGSKVVFSGDAYWCSLWLVGAFFVKVYDGFQGIVLRPAAEGGLLKSKVFTSAAYSSCF
jgi:hypothetical protein